MDRETSAANSTAGRKCPLYKQKRDESECWSEAGRSRADEEQGRDLAATRSWHVGVSPRVVQQPSLSKPVPHHSSPCKLDWYADCHRSCGHTITAMLSLRNLLLWLASKQHSSELIVSLSTSAAPTLHASTRRRRRVSKAPLYHQAMCCPMRAPADHRLDCLGAGRKPLTGSAG